MTRVLALAGQSKIGCITQRRFAKAGTKIDPQRGAALDRNGLSVSTETACRFEPKSPVGNSEICSARSCRGLPRGRCRLGHPICRRRYQELVARKESPDLAALGAREIDWANRLMHLDVDRQKVKDSPAYDATTTVDQTYEERFHDHYGGDWPGI